MSIPIEDALNQKRTRDEILVLHEAFTAWLNVPEFVPSEEMLESMGRLFDLAGIEDDDIGRDGVQRCRAPGAMVIVPNAVARALDKATDDAIAATGDPAAVDDRAYIRNMLLAYYAEYGAIPEITLEKLP